LVIVRTRDICNSCYWLTLINPEPDENNDLVIQDAIPIKNDLIRDASFYYDGSGVYLNYVTDTIATRKRLYFMSAYGFESETKFEELSPSEKVSLTIDELF